MSILQYNNGNLNYILKKNSGFSLPVVFIHGFALDSREWRYQIDSCNRNKFSYIAYDMRGFGKSSTPVLEYSHAEDLNALISKLSVNKVIVCGHSFGGEVALDFVLKYPHKSAGLILVSPSLGSVGIDEKSFFAELKHLAKSAKANFVRHQIVNHESVQLLKRTPAIFELVKEMIDDYSLWHFLNQDFAVSIYDNVTKINQVQCPTKILVGSLDSKSSVHISQEISKKIKNAELEIVKDCGHFLNLECPNSLNKTIGKLVFQLKI